MSKYISLSYIITEDLSAYGNGERLKKENIRSIKNGDTSNNSVFKLSSHLGTHIDFPFHFCDDGSTLSDFSVENLIFDKISIIEFDMLNQSNLLLGEQLYPLINKLDYETDCLLIKTNFCTIRDSKKYWNMNPGFQPYFANYLKKKFPFLRAIGFDSISLSSYSNREIGREAHKEFLCKNSLLIIEDMDLSKINLEIEINKLIIAPLLIDGADGSPVNVIAEVNND